MPQFAANLSLLFPYAWEKREMAARLEAHGLQQAHDVVAEVAAPKGDVASKLRRYLPDGKIGHIQITGVPERHEPDSGELNNLYLFALLDELADPGWLKPWL